MRTSLPITRHFVGPAFDEHLSTDTLRETDKPLRVSERAISVGPHFSEPPYWSLLCSWQALKPCSIFGGIERRLWLE